MINDSTIEKIKALPTRIKEEGGELIVDNYKGLCKLFDLPIEGGDSKVRQLKELSHYLEFEKMEGCYKYIIKRVKVENINTVIPKNPTKYSDNIYALLILYIKRCGVRVYNEDGIPTNWIRFEFKEYQLYQLVGLNNDQYFKEYIHISNRTMPPKKNFFYLHGKESALVIKEFKNAMKKGRFPSDFHPIECKYMTRLLLIGEKGERIPLTDDMREKLDKEMEKEREEKINRCKERIQRRFGSDAKWKTMKDNMFDIAQKNGEFNVPHWSTKYITVRESRLMDKEEEKIFHKIERDVCTKLNVASRQDAKFKKMIRSYDRAIRRSMEKELKFSKCETSYRFEVNDAWLTDQILKVSGIDLSPLYQLSAEYIKNYNLSIVAADETSRGDNDLTYDFNSSSCRGNDETEADKQINERLGKEMRQMNESVFIRPPDEDEWYEAAFHPTKIKAAAQSPTPTPPEPPTEESVMSVEELLEALASDNDNNNPIINKEELRRKLISRMRSDLDETITSLTLKINQTFIASFLKHQEKWAAEIDAYVFADHLQTEYQKIASRAFYERVPLEELLPPEKEEEVRALDKHLNLVGTIKNHISDEYLHLPYINIIEAFLEHYVRIKEPIVKGFILYLFDANGRLGDDPFQRMKDEGWEPKPLPFLS